jgi:hypothetical protein
MDALLGRFAPLLSRAEREPVLEPASGIHPLRRRGTASLDR